MQPYRRLLILLLLVLSKLAYSQNQDVEFHPYSRLLPGKVILKVKRDFKDPFLWVLAANNQVFRVNSNTLAVDDYTPQFAQYNNLQFIDIAGKNNDNVYIASNTTNVVEYKSGATKIIGAADGLIDIVTSIGVSNFDVDLKYGAVEIGTAKGRGQYDAATGQLTYFQYDRLTDIKVYEANYRNFTAKVNRYDYSYPTETPVSNYGLGGGGIFTISPTTESGTNINTVLTTQPYLSSPLGNFYETSVFWGNEKGLFEEPCQRYNAPIPLNHKLTGIKVNKVTDMFGLVSLGNPYFNGGDLIKQNLLVGTDQGLYFSSSIYGNFQQGQLHAYAMFHYDLLGSVKVNDINVNGTAGDYAEAPQGCENGVWVATDNGLYLIRPDYGKYLSPDAMVHGMACENIPFPDPGTTVTLCHGDEARFYLNNSVGDNTTIQWVRNGVDLLGKTDRKLAVTDPGDYYAVIYTPCENVHVQTNHFKVVGISAPVFTFNYDDKLAFCGITSTNLSVESQSNYQYRWYTNGVLNGNTTNQYTVVQSGKYKVEVSACANSWVPSKEIEVDLVNLPVPNITADNNNHCEGYNAQLTVDVPADPSYTINWYLDGNILNAEKNKTTIQAATNGGYSVMLQNNIISTCTSASNTLPLTFTSAPVFTFNYPNRLQYCAGTPVALKVDGSDTYQYRWYANEVLNGNSTKTQMVTQTGKYRVEVSSCEGTWVTSREVNVLLLQIPKPVIKSDKAFYCMGDKSTLSITVPSDPSYVIDWYKDGVQFFQYTDKTEINTDLNGDYTVQIKAKNANTDGDFCRGISDVKHINFEPLPTAHVEQIIKTTLCSGQPVDLKLTYDAGTVHWNTGEISDNITVNSSGTYTATLTTMAGCTTDVTTIVQFLANPVLQLADVAVCASAKKTATLTAPAGMVNYSWNGITGTNTYTVDRAQTVTLTVTDANGCNATQEVKITDDCPDIAIPNAFTPNGDGVNDKWEIAGLEHDPSADVMVFNRYGQRVYHSSGYTNSWDGTVNGKKLPASVYYYLIKAKNNAETYSGSLTIVF